MTALVGNGPFTLPKRQAELRRLLDKNDPATALAPVAAPPPARPRVPPPPPLPAPGGDE